MALRIRRAGEVADGSITSSKLADGAVDLSTVKVTGQLPTQKLADGAIIESKLAELSISTGKLMDNVVTLAKADDDIRAISFTGDETELSVTGMSEIAIKGFFFTKKAGTGAINPKRLRIILTLKTSNVSYIATAKIYIDNETLARATFTSNSLTYELLSTEFVISDLNQSKHDVSLKLRSSNAAGIAFNDYIDVLLVK